MIIRSWVEQLDGPVAVAYEAGPTGFGLYRALTAAGIRCVVAAPSKLQRPCGDRVKTDAKDAVHLARLLRLGEITPVTVPSVDQEAARDLVRAREDCRGDLMRARHRLSKLLLRQGIVYCGGQAWTAAHGRWLRQQQFDQPATRLAFESDYEAAVAISARRDRLVKAIVQMAADSEFTAVVRRLCCLRGVSTLTGFALAVEIGDWHRFTGNTIGSFVGLVPSEHSSGASRVQGSITKTGNTHVRRVLVEAAWYHRARYIAGKPCGIDGNWNRQQPASVAKPGTGDCRREEREGGRGHELAAAVVWSPVPRDQSTTGERTDNQDHGDVQRRERFTTFHIAVELPRLPCGLDVDQSTSVGGTSPTQWTSARGGAHGERDQRDGDERGVLRRSGA